MRDYVVAWLLRDPEDQAHLVARVRKACRRQTVPRTADHCAGSRASSAGLRGEGLGCSSRANPGALTASVSVLARHRPCDIEHAARHD